jgi:bifunctional UDP-N-acetylglucosamine pyrophosphorylase/glucosamine-1-phosphate N-acetyltransferase
VLHQLAGKSLLQHVIDTASSLVGTAKPIVIYGHEGEQIKAAFTSQPINFVEQTTQLGTGHAVLQALPHINDADRVLILYGDVPLISASTLQVMLDEIPEDSIGIVTTYLKNPHGYGRILRNRDKEIKGIVEEKDASDEERRITEVNSGIYLVPAHLLKEWLPAITPHNAQGEIYLTDIISQAVAEEVDIITIQPEHKDEIRGVNDRMQLSYLERSYQRRLAFAFMEKGVTIMDPERVDFRGDIKIGRDVVIDVNVILEGDVTIGDGCKIEANTLIRNTTLGLNVLVHTHSVIDGSFIADDCIIGPFARLRPEAELGKAVRVGNFVEIKKSKIGAGSKVNHLSYVGDSDIGKRVNVGAGTITCNYDGANKHKTIIGDDVFIGSCTQLVAPVNIGEGATIGAGSTITLDAPPHQLTLSRVEQRTVADWVRPDKREKIKS